MTKLEKLTSNLIQQMGTFEAEARNSVDGNKAAGRRARKLSSEIGKGLKEYRKLSVEAEKK
jgi:hypothetical protein